MHRIAFSIATLFAIASPAFAANENVITQSKALAGNVTPGDTPGFPITINTPGAYVLGSGLDVTPGQWGIVVNANGVDIDMSGYTLSGNGNADYGVVSGYTNGRIHDGSISSFKAAGMYIRGDAWSIDSMTIQRNSSHGIDATGSRYVSVEGSLITSNNQSGAKAGDNGVFRNSTFSQNKDIGIYCRNDCHVEGNTIDHNRIGISIFTGMVIGNTISSNIFEGVQDILPSLDTGLANNMLIENNPSGFNQTAGIQSVHPNVCSGKPC